MRRSYAPSHKVSTVSSGSLSFSIEDRLEGTSFSLFFHLGRTGSFALAGRTMTFATQAHGLLSTLLIFSE